MHTAQNRELPREVFGEVAEILGASPGELAVKGGRIVMPRYANGQEEIRMKNGGSYRIVAPTRGGARGPSNDDVIIDEVRELDNFDFIAAAKPTLTASKNPQMHYRSNMGDDSSLVLNALSLRASADPSLAYLEWSAAPERAAGDIKGWIEANPSIGHLSGILSYLEREYRTNQLQGTLAIFETEHLCRRVATMREHLVDAFAWARCKDDELEEAYRPTMAVSMSPDGKRATCAVAWIRDDNTVGLRLLYNVPGDPIDTAALGKDLQQTASRLGIRHIGYDPLTDQQLVKYFKKAEPISGQKFANASAQFVNLVSAGQLRWSDADAVTDDLTWTSRKQDRETGTYQAVRAQDDRSITASLAAIRAVWLASGPKPSTPKVM
jgi:phage terminase large subunit-like protein